MNLRRRPRLTLRARATVVATVVFVLTLACGSVLLVTTLESHLTSASDQLARARIRDLLDLAAHDALPTELRNVDDEGVAQVVDDRRRVLAASANVAGRPAVDDTVPGTSYLVRTVRAPDDSETETYRLWSASGPGPDGTVTVYLGNSLESVSEASAALRHALWLGVPLVSALLGLITWLVLGRVLGRLDRIRAEVDQITDQRLSARVDGDGVPDEVGRLAATMNAMLGRLEAASQRQRRFVADVSHDLQSPLTSQRVSLELALRDPAGVDAERLWSEVLGATAEMERLVRDLLDLAAADEADPAPAAPFDLDELVLEEATRARVGSVTIDTSRVSAAPVRANRGDVRRIIRNLLDNATEHAAGRVELRLDAVGGQVRLDVVDDGPGVGAEHRGLVFDRFYRADTARSREGGSGLGLAIARTLAERAGGGLELVPRSPGAHFRLVLPALGALPETQSR